MKAGVYLGMRKLKKKKHNFLKLLIMYFIYLKGVMACWRKAGEREKEKKKNLLSNGLFPKFLQQPWLGQAEAGSLEPGLNVQQPST